MAEPLEFNDYFVQVEQPQGVYLLLRWDELLGMYFICNFANNKKGCQEWWLGYQAAMHCCMEHSPVESRRSHQFVCLYHRYCVKILEKPFNPILGETLEYVPKDDSFKFIAEQVISTYSS